MRDFHHHAFVDHWARVVLQFAADQEADAVEFDVGNDGGLALKRHDVHNACALEDRQTVGGIESGETVAREQGPVDLLLAVLPATPARDGRQERFYALAIELFANDLLMTRARPERVPLRSVVHCDAPGPALACAASPSSYAFFMSGFFQSMIACALSFTRYFWNSSRRLSLTTRSLI